MGVSGQLRVRSSAQISWISAWAAQGALRAPGRGGPAPIQDNPRGRPRDPLRSDVAKKRHRGKSRSEPSTPSLCGMFRPGSI
eukprot:1901109-Pyramimonas_sp.AAC.1